MIDVIEMLHDPDFSTEFTFGIAGGYRTVKGEWVETIASAKKAAVIQPASNRDLKYLAEGDELRQAINIWSTEYLSSTDRLCPQKGDVIGWHDKTYRIVNVEDWSQYGYWKAMAMQEIGDSHE